MHAYEYVCIDPRIDRLRPLETRDALGFCSAPGGALCQVGRPDGLLRTQEQHTSSPSQRGAQGGCVMGPS